MSTTIAATAALAVALLAAPAAAQTIDQLRDAVRDAVASTRITLFLATLHDLAVDGEVAAGHLKVDGENGGPGLGITSLSVPWRKDLFTDEPDGLGGLHVEATVGYADARLDLDDLWSGQLPGLETRVITEYEAIGVDLGAGPNVDLGGGYTVQPLAHLALSYVDNDATYIGPGAGVTQAITSGILFDWDGIYGAYGMSVAMRRAPLRLGDIEVRPLLRYDLRHIVDLDVDDRALEADDTTNWITLRADLEGPIGGDPDARLRWLADVGYRRWFAGAADTLGFDDFVEFGAGIAWRAADALPLLSDLRLGGAVQVGDDVLGWSFGLSASF
ncbi:MAG: hypothetical protein AB7O97_18120 [Planctomycetota bacterium]